MFIFDNQSCVFYSSDYGANWELIMNGIPQGVLSSIPHATSFCGDSLNIFFGTSIDGIFSSTDKGNHWTAVNNGLPKNSSSNDSRAVTWINVLLLNGSNIFAGTRDGIFISSDNSNTWSAINTGLPTSETFDLFSNNSVIFASVNVNNISNGIYRTTNNGNSWVKASNGLPEYKSLGSLVIKDSLIFGIDYDVIYKTTNNGDNWELVSQGSFSDLAIFNSNLYTCRDSGVFVSTDDGIEWTPVNNGLQKKMNNGFPSSISSYKSILATYINWDNKRYISTDEGDNWLQYNGIDENNVDTYAEVGANFFDLNGYFIKTAKENKWKRIYSPYSGQPRPFLYTNDLMMVDTILFAATNQGIWHTGYSNSSLIYCCSPENWNTNLTNLECFSLSVNGNNIYVGTSNGVYISTDLGLNWNLIGLSNKSITNLFSIDSDFIANTDAGFFRSKDGGNTWNDFNIGLNNIHGLVLCGDNLFALTYITQYWDGIIWKRSFNEIMTDVNSKEQLPHEFSLSQNYPNPFNPSTTIKYSIPTSLNPSKGGTLVSLKVFDLLGREVATLVNEQKLPGNYEVKFDGSGLPSGVYFYKLAAGDFMETKKMLLLK